MKKFILLATVAFSTAAFAQKMDCTATKAELTNVKAENAELSKQNLYYKETLHLLTPIKSVDIDGLKFDVISAVGSRKDKTLTITVVYANTTSEPREQAAVDRVTIVDPQGNQYEKSGVYMGGKDFWARNVQPGIPMKGKVEISITEGEFPIIRQMTWHLLSNKNFYNKITTSFENIPVVWKD